MIYDPSTEYLIEKCLKDGNKPGTAKAYLLKWAKANDIDLAELEEELKTRMATIEDNNKKHIVPQELDDLIQEFLTDGIISAKERQVLLNKAKTLGLNLDEVDLYIDAQQQKADQAVAAALNKRRGKACPYCGGIIPELADKCPHCGANITPEASKELSELINKIEQGIKKIKASTSSNNIQKAQAEVESCIQKAKLYYGKNTKVQELTERVAEELSICPARIKEVRKEEKKNATKERRAKIRKRIKWYIIFICIALYFIGWNTIKQVLEFFFK